MQLKSLLCAGVLGLLLTPGVGAQTAGSGKTAEENYKATCQPCHMADGNAALKPMNFADGEWKHGTTPQALAKVIAEGVPGTAMMPFKTRFSETGDSRPGEVRAAIRPEAEGRVRGPGEEEAGAHAVAVRHAAASLVPLPCCRAAFSGAGVAPTARM